MLYDYHTGHRVKDPFNHIAWVHKSENTKNFHLKQCLFGLHLLRPDTKIVAIVEAEKTAVVASIFFSDVLFLATGGLQNLNAERCAPLKGHRVILFPVVLVGILSVLHGEDTVLPPELTLFTSVPLTIGLICGLLRLTILLGMLSQLSLLRRWFFCWRYILVMIFRSLFSLTANKSSAISRSGSSFYILPNSLFSNIDL